MCIPIILIKFILAAFAAVAGARVAHTASVRVADGFDNGHAADGYEASAAL